MYAALNIKYYFQKEKMPSAKPIALSCVGSYAYVCRISRTSGEAILQCCMGGYC